MSTMIHTEPVIRWTALVQGGQTHAFAVLPGVLPEARDSAFRSQCGHAWALGHDLENAPSRPASGPGCSFCWLDIGEAGS